MSVAFFKTAFGYWGYRIKFPANGVWETFGFKTKRGAMRDYHFQKKYIEVGKK
jgi:hypothetical protein